MRQTLGIVHYHGRRFEAAISEERRALELFPHLALARDILAPGAARHRKTQRCNCRGRAAISTEKRRDAGDVGDRVRARRRPATCHKFCRRAQRSTTAPGGASGSVVCRDRRSQTGIGVARSRGIRGRPCLAALARGSRFRSRAFRSTLSRHPASLQVANSCAPRPQPSSDAALIAAHRVSDRRAPEGSRSIRVSRRRWRACTRS